MAATNFRNNFQISAQVNKNPIMILTQNFWIQDDEDIVWDNTNNIKRDLQNRIVKIADILVPVSLENHGITVAIGEMEAILVPTIYKVSLK